MKSEQKKFKKKQVAAVACMIAAAGIVTSVILWNGKNAGQSVAEYHTDNTETLAQSEETAKNHTVFQVSSKIDEKDQNADWQSEDYSSITADASGIHCDSSKVTIEEGNIIIREAGTYVFQGTIANGQVVVDAEDAKVWIVLNDVDITCGNSAAIYVKAAKKTIITAAAGTQNSLTDGTAYEYDDVEKEEPNACLFSKDDLVINGSGKLTVQGNFNNGIAGKNDVLIVDTELSVTAVNHGIKGKDCICIQNGTITIKAGGDGMKTTNTEDAERGFICIESGSYQITAGQDGIDCETCMLIQNGIFTIQSGGGAANAVKKSSREDFGWDRDSNSNAQTTETVSTKGIKAGVALTVERGSFNIDSADDAIHTNGDIIIQDGNYAIATGDDGIHADVNLNIDGGTIVISQSYEGLEAQYITIAEGTIDIVSSDDGLNAATGTVQNSGRGGMDEKEDAWIAIKGGTVTINADGDGMDSNGDVEMSGGTVMVYGPTNGGNGALDYSGSFQMSGGTLVAAGAQGMDQNISSSSTQYGVNYVLSATAAADSKVVIQAEDGTEIVAFTAEKTFQSIVFSTPAMKDGMTYTIFVNGTEQGTITQSGIATTNSSGGMGGNGFGGGQRPAGGQQDNMQNGGEIPQKPEGETPPDMGNVPEGGTPQMPEGETPPDMPAGGQPSERGEQNSADNGQI